MFRPTLVIIRCLKLLVKTAVLPFCDSNIRCACACEITRSLEAQHNRKSHPTPWNTRVRRRDYTSNIRTTKQKHNTFHQQFYTPDDDQYRSKHVVQCTETLQ
jgi:hypothetical protein